jgi:hypothetical protein
MCCLRLIGFTELKLQALNDGQHPPAGMGAGVPSGQALKSIVQYVPAQLGLTDTGTTNQISSFHSLVRWFTYVREHSGQHREQVVSRPTSSYC